MLDEAVYADILIIVVDASDGEFASELEVTEDLLRDLGAVGKPTIYLFNKCDRITESERLLDMKRIAASSGAKYAFISAATGEGIEDFVSILEELCSAGKRTVKATLPQSEGALLGLIYKDGENVEVEYTTDGIEVTVTCDEKLYGKLKRFIED